MNRYRLKGGVLIEFALVIPLVMAVVLAVFDFGSYYHDRMFLQNVAISAAKYRARNCGYVTNANIFSSVIAPELAYQNTIQLAPSDITTKTVGTQRFRMYPVYINYRRSRRILSTFLVDAAGLRNIKVEAFSACEFECAGDCQ